MTINELIKIIKGTCILKSETVINKIKTDSRNINENDIFIALKGKKYNGNDYILEALEKGACFCITDIYLNEKCILVNNTYDSLFYLGNYFRNKYDIPLIAITGSNGKTTTREIIYSILSQNSKVLKNTENNNNIIGVFNTLILLDNSYDYILLELGSNHLGEISTLSKMCNPTYSIITNIGSSHIGYFGSKKNIFKEKYSIKDGMKNNDIIVNGDDRYLKKINTIKCGLSKTNDLRAYNIRINENYLEFKIKLDKEYLIQFNNIGKHFINDILLAIKLCLVLNIDINDIINGIKKYKTMENRMEKYIDVNNNIIISDCYNSSIESLKVGLNSLNVIKSSKIYVIIGDILELGKYTKNYHKKIKKYLKNNLIVYTVGSYTKLINSKNFSNVDDIIKYLKIKNIKNSCIYIKGSNKNQLYKIKKIYKKKL